MTTKILVIEDHNGEEIEVYMNQNMNVIIQQRNEEIGFSICLKQEDVTDLVHELRSFLTEMEGDE